jgi:hypothetical protein
MILCEKWRLAYDENNVILEFFETRERKKKGTDEKEPFEFVEQFYYPNVKTALTAFTQKYMKGSEDVEDILDRIDGLENLIKNLKL